MDSLSSKKGSCEATTTAAFEPSEAAATEDMSAYSNFCVIAWKLRSGLGRFLYSRSETGGWEQRVIEINGSSLQYYEIGEAHMNGKVRNRLDIVENQVQVQVASAKTPEAPTPHEVDIAFVPTSKKTKNEGQGDPLVQPPAANIDNKLHGNNKLTNQPQQHWKFCFEQQEDLMAFLEAVHNALEIHHQLEEKDAARFEHDFQAGDHIFRWEMIVCPPVIYPIQIHGIVLDAGRNCVVVADFGLTGYSRKQGEDFHHADDNQQTNVVLQAFRKLRPNQDQRLTIVALTDPHELRKWYRANYSESATSSHSHKNLEKIGQFMGKLQEGTQKFRQRRQQQQQQQQRSRANTEEDYSNPSGDDHLENHDKMNESSRTSRVTTFMSKLKLSLSSERMDSLDGTEEKQTKHSLNVDGGDNELPKAEIVDEPEVVPLSGSMAEKISPTKEIDTAESEDNNATVSTTASASTSTSAEQQQQQQGRKQTRPAKKASEELPRSDPTEIVLARANFVLEHEDVLPPYHIFFSNSECIATWCKTGRWSTLQTAVFLASNSVGGAKSATLTTIGLAATNALLAPVVALGGAVYVCAPMIILKKSQERWEEITNLMTDAFWQWAPPAIYVAAIEHWSGLAKERKAAVNTTTTAAAAAAAGKSSSTEMERK